LRTVRTTLTTGEVMGWSIVQVPTRMQRARVGISNQRRTRGDKLVVSL
jgi:hypothetical protein